MTQQCDRDHESIIRLETKVENIQADVKSLSNDLWGNGKPGIKMVQEQHGGRISNCEKRIGGLEKAGTRKSDRVFTLISGCVAGLVLLVGQAILKRFGM